MESLTSDIQRFAITLVDKTKELSREKRKTDTLLYQMVPKQVAEILKRSGEVEAEYFKADTVFFSEVTPMDVVALLNNLYTFMDGVLDSYMIASGLPERNGDSHSSKVANLALDLIRRVNERRTFFLSSRQISLRIGINTGPVVTGIVGSKMPRYCLFGDTVNTASRMESNGLRTCSY